MLFIICFVIGGSFPGSNCFLQYAVVRLCKFSLWYLDWCATDDYSIDGLGGMCQVIKIF